MVYFCGNKIKKIKIHPSNAAFHVNHVSCPVLFVITCLFVDLYYTALELQTHKKTAIFHIITPIIIVAIYGYILIVVAERR